MLRSNYKLLRFSFTKITSAYSVSRSYRNVPNISLAKYMSTKISTEEPIVALAERFPAPKSEENISPDQNNRNSELEFVVKLKNDPDVFGSPTTEAEVYDEGDLQEETYLENQPLPSQKLRTKQYADMIKTCIRQRRLKEAIDIVEVRMLKDDRAKVNNYIFNLLLGGCGRVGYTKKAFSLFNKMKKRGLKPTGGTYTALFNACSNSPWPEDGLTRATRLRNLMSEKMFEPNETTYNAMIKAFGRCGDLPTAFSIADEMKSKKFKLKDDTLNFLLQACINDKEAGFRHALLVWRKLVQYKIKPSIYTYNLMIRSVRDCGMGDIEATQDVIRQILDDRKKYLKVKDTKLIQQSMENSTQLIAKPLDDALIPTNQDVENNAMPNLMAVVPHLGNVISVAEVKTAQDRLLLVGGLKGVIKSMEDNEARPSIKTFTQLLDCIPGNMESEKELLKIIKKHDIEPDIDFFNMLIKKRSMRSDYESAREVLKLLTRCHYRPNLITYGVLALGCKNKEDAMNLVDDMRNGSYTLNSEILGAMLHQACHHMNFAYVLEVMETVLKEQVRPNKRFMERLEEFRKKMKHISNDYNNPLASTVKFQKGHRIFQMRYKTWIQEVEVDETEDEHPWTQFRQDTETHVRNYRDGVARFKPRRNSMFRVETSTKTKFFSKRMRT